MGEAKQRRVRNTQSMKLETFNDATNTPKILTDLIDAGKLKGIVSLYRFEGSSPGLVQVQMMNHGMKIEEVFDFLCIVRRSMMDNMGFIDLADPSMMEQRQAAAVAETAPEPSVMSLITGKQPFETKCNECDGSGRSYHNVLREGRECIHCSGTGTVKVHPVKCECTSCWQEMEAGGRA